MANYFVADGAPTTGTGSIVLAVQGQFTIDLGTPSGINTGDVVKFGSTYGVVQDQFGNEYQCGYDDRIYAVPSGSGAFSVYSKAALPANGITISVPSYNLQTEVLQAYYSQSYIKYNTTKRYTLTIGNKKRINLGDFHSLIQNNPLFLVDDCTYIDGVVYSLAAESSTIDSINNAFKNSVEFRLAAQ
jgi:hypothetical protein